MNGNQMLLDTSVVIEIIRLRNKNKQTNQIDFIGMNPLISILTIGELWAGKYFDKDEDYFKVFLKGVKVLNINTEIVKEAGLIMRDSNYKVKYVDAAIAATALRHKLTLMTYNYKDFKDIKDLEILTKKSLRK